MSLQLSWMTSRKQWGTTTTWVLSCCHHDRSINFIPPLCMIYNMMCKQQIRRKISQNGCIVGSLCAVLALIWDGVCSRENHNSRKLSFGTVQPWLHSPPLSRWFSYPEDNRGCKLGWEEHYSQLMQCSALHNSSGKKILNRTPSCIRHKVACKWVRVMWHL